MTDRYIGKNKTGSRFRGLGSDGRTTKRFMCYQGLHYHTSIENATKCRQCKENVELVERRNERNRTKE